MKVYKAKKLFGNIASVRDYIVNQAIDNGEGLRIEYKGKAMMLSPDDLVASVFQCHKTKFKSKYAGGKDYELYDFIFKPDQENKLF